MFLISHVKTQFYTMNMAFLIV